MSKNVLITGGTRGIGRAAVEEFASNGWRVLFCYRKSEGAAKAICDSFPLVEAMCADLSDPVQVAALFSHAKSTFKTLDAVVLNAGVSHCGLFTDLNEEQFEEIINIDFKSVFYSCQHSARMMIPEKHGSIITLGSMWGQTGASCEVAYSAAKAGIIGLTKALAKELGPSGIRVNCVSPGVIDTDMNAFLQSEDVSSLCEQTPLCRMGNPREAAKCIYFLADETQSSFVTGQVLSVNGGIYI